MSYADTFIRIAPDSTRSEAMVPEARGGKKTVAVLQYELLTEKPDHFTEQELYFRVHCLREGIGGKQAEQDREGIWSRLFAKPQACLRASPLPKTYGWGVRYDAKGRIRLIPVGTPEYEEACASELKQLPAMRSKREGK